MRDNIQAVLAPAGHGGRVVALPEQPAVLALKALELPHLSPLYRWAYETAAGDSFVSVDRIETRLGFTPRHSNREALAGNYDGYVAHRYDFAPDARVSHRAPLSGDEGGRSRDFPRLPNGVPGGPLIHASSRRGSARVPCAREESP